MATTKIKIGEIPIGRGEWNASVEYYKENTVTLYDMSFRAKHKVGKGVAPAVIGSDGKVALRNTDVWELMSGNPATYNTANDVEKLSHKVDNIKPIIINGNVTNAPDEEDITFDGNNLLKLKDRSAGNGMGYVILRTDKTFAEQVTQPNTIYEIRYDFDLNGAEVTIPDGCVLKFEGGSLKNGSIYGVGTSISNCEDTKIFFDITGSITDTPTVIHTSWFGKNCSDVNRLISIFQNANVIINTNLVHDETIIIPYDISINADKVIKITAQSNVPVFSIYNSNKSIKLSNVIVLLETPYNMAVTEYRGDGYENIRGYSKLLSDVFYDIYLPKVIGSTQGYATDNESIGCKIITADGEEGEYNYIYYKHFHGTYKNIRHGLYIDTNNNTGTLTTNRYNITCWWCVNCITTTSELPPKNIFNLNCQCNVYTRKLYYNINFSTIEYDKEDATLYVDLYDAHHIPEDYRFTLIDGQQFMNVNGKGSEANAHSMRAYLTRKNEYPYKDKRGSCLNESEIGDMAYIYGNQQAIFTILRNLEHTFESYILGLVKYFNHNSITRSVRVIYNCGARIAANEEQRKVARTLANSTVDITNDSTITIDFKLSLYKKPSLIQTVVWQLHDNTTKEHKKLTMNVYYDENSNITIERVNEIWDGVTIDSEIELKDYGLPEETMVTLAHYNMNAKYDARKKLFIGIDGNPICNVNSLSDFTSAPYYRVGAIWSDGTTSYQVIQIGECPVFRFEFQTIPTEDSTLTVNIGDDTYTIDVSLQNEAFLNAFRDALNKVLVAAYVSDVSISVNYVYVMFLKHETIYSGVLKSYEVRNGEDIIATSIGHKYGKPNILRIITQSLATRPTNPNVGDCIFDTTLKKPIWWNGTAWVDATGATV